MAWDVAPMFFPSKLTCHRKELGRICIVQMTHIRSSAFNRNVHWELVETMPKNRFSKVRETLPRNCYSSGSELFMPQVYAQNAEQKNTLDLPPTRCQAQSASCFGNNKWKQSCWWRAMLGYWGAPPTPESYSQKSPPHRGRVWFGSPP